MEVVFLFAELIFLYLLSRRLIQAIYRLLFTIVRSRSAAIWIVTILFFPGTVVHELAHLFVAEVLRVRTGKITLVPESLEGKEIKAGGVMIAETDPLRRTLIGLSPIYVGVGVLTAISNIPILPILTFYCMFAVSNSMFSSKEDMKGVIPFTITVALFVAAGYFAGFRLGLTEELLAGLHPVVQALVRSLGMVLGVNLVVLAATSILLAVLAPRRKNA